MLPRLAEARRAASGQAKDHPPAQQVRANRPTQLGREYGHGRQHCARSRFRRAAHDVPDADTDTAAGCVTVTEVLPTSPYESFA